MVGSSLQQMGRWGRVAFCLVGRQSCKQKPPLPRKVVAASRTSTGYRGGIGGDSINSAWGHHGKPPSAGYHGVFIPEVS